MAKDLDLTEFGGAPQLDLNEFNQPAAKPASAARRAADTGLALGRGIIAVPEAAVGVSNLVTGGRTGQAVERLGVRFKDAKQVLTDLQSDEQKAADAQVQEADGFLPTLGAMVRNPSTIANAAAESLPSMLAGGALSQGLVKRGVGAITAGAAGEGVFSAGSSAEQVRQESGTGFLTPKQAALAATSGAVTGAINRVSGKVAEKLGIADVNTTMATGKLGGATEKGVARRIGEGTVNEGVLQELPQSMQEQALQNVALDKPIGEGVAQAGASGMLVGGLTGGAFGAASGPPKAPGRVIEDPSAGAPPQPPPAPPAQPGVSPGVLPGVFSSKTQETAQAPQTPAAPPAPPPVSKAQAMGINPAAGPLSAGAAISVNTGADVVTQQQAAEKQKAEAAAKDKAKPGPDGKKPEPEAPPPVQPAPANPAAPITGPFTQAIHGASNAPQTPAPAVDPQGLAPVQPDAQAAGPAADAPAAPGVGADQGPQGAGPVPAALPEPVTEVPPVTQPPTQESTNASTAEVIDPETGEITRPGPQGEGGDGVQRPADAVQPGADAEGTQRAADEPAAPASAGAPPEGGTAAPVEPSEKDRRLKVVADTSRLSPEGGTRVGGLINGQVSYLGDPDRTMDGRKLMMAVDAALRAGATPQEVVDAATKPAPATPKPLPAEVEAKADEVMRAIGQIGGPIAITREQVVSLINARGIEAADKTIKGILDTIKRNNEAASASARAPKPPTPATPVDMGGEAGKKPLPRKGKQADGGTVRGMDYTGRPIDGKPVNAGDIFATSSGRQTTPYPSSKRQQAASQWLIDNAIAEATSRDDTMNAAVFGNEKPMKDGSLPPASQDSMLEYLFGQQPAVPKSILKPLAPASNAGGAAATQEQAAADKEPTSKAPAKPTGGKNLRNAAYERNPLLTFLAKHGLFHDKDKPGSQKSEFSPDRQVMVMGYGPVFRKNGRQLDELLPLAIQDGYLPPGSNEADLANLIASAIRGNRVAPMFTDDGAEKAAALRDQRDREDYERKQAEVFADLDRQASEELEGALADLTDAEFSTLRAELLDGPVADIDAESNTDVRSAMKALGFTDQEIDDATAQGQGAPGQDGAGRSGPAEAAGQGQGEGAQQGVDATAEGSQDDEGLTSPTRDDVIAQQDRAENAQALDDKAQIDREAEGFQLQAQTVDTRTDTTGDMVGGPSVDDYQQDMARRRKPGTEPQGPSLFDQPEEPQPAAPAAANPDVLRAQADLQNALADLADIFGKNTRANMMPEQEQKMLPVLVKVFDAAFRLGYHKFKDAAKFALDQIRKALGDDAANAITLDHLQGAYISMSGGRPQADTKRAVIDVEDKADIESHVATKGDGPDIVKTYPATAAGTQLQIVRTPDGHNVEMLDTDRGKYMPTIRAFKGEDSLKKAIEFVESPEQNARQERLNVPSPDRSVEPDRAKPAAGPAVGAPVSPGPAGTDQGTGQDGRRAQGQGGGRTGDTRVPADGAAAGGERSDQLFRGDDQPPRSEVVDARTDFGERSGDSGITGVPPEPIPAGKVDAIAVRGDDELRKRGQQVAASKLEAKPGDLANIRETLPYLLPGQQEDVHKAEQRFSKPTGYGMLFTNGTGTGKTFTGLGVIKRFAMQGKKNTLIIVPDDKIAEDWVTSGKALGLDITRLASTKDKGKGIVITTYANMGDNDEIANRKWDLIVPDEAHSLMQSADGTPTSYLQNLRAITHHPDGWVQRFTMQNRDLLAQQKALSDQIIANNKIANLDDTMDVMRESLGRENAKLEAQLAPISKKLNEARDAVRDEVAAMQGEKRARLVFLSATPFAYEKTVDWANGYLFDYKDGYPYTETSLAYNQPNPREHFFMTRFGYSMRYNKLTEPDGTKIDRGLMQRQFNGELKKAGVLSGRMLDVPADYDRRFVLVDSAIGNKIDEALAWLTEKTKGDRNDQAVRGYDALRSVIEGQFDYLSRRYLLEAIKAQEVVPIIKKHMAMGRKVVVFHDYKKGGAVNPFDISSAPAAADAEMAGKVAAFNAANADFRASFPELVSGLKGLRSPIEVFNREFPGVLLINGDEKKADLLRRYKGFQSDDTGPQVMLVQSAKNKGWSGHDTTGKHQRVLINLGQPTAPTLAIQQEGRIYRTGQVSNAIMRYLNTGTNWERWTFASTIASRASTAENLGMGELARALKDSFIASFEESDTYPPGHEGEGTGGKERDKAANNAITEYDRAKTYYWATQKKNSKTKAQEGADYFATPEPVGLKMVQWLDIRPGEGALEPSAGHGAIARWLPDVAKRTVIEPSLALRSRLAMVMNPSEDRIIAGTFEDLAVTNKYDGIAMNPPFGTAGKTAIDHLAKAATHVRDGGRIVALIPTGPAADKKFEKWFYEKTERPIKPLVDLDLGMGKEPLYRGDTIKSVISWQSGVVTGRTEAGMLRVKTGSPGETLVPEKNVAGIARTGQRTESFSPAADLHLIADIKLPQVTFERAGTAVPTRIVVIQKNTDKDAVIPQQRNVDLSDITDIKELFDRLENLDIAKRVIPEAAAPATPGRPARVMSDQEAPAAKPAKAAKAEVNVGDKVTIGGKEYTIEVYTTNAGKEKRGVWMDSREEAQKYSQRTFTTSTKRGKWFVDEYWFPKTPPVASEPGARYSVKEPEAPYETDLFGQPVPAPTGRSAPARPTSTRIRRDVQPAAGVQDTPAPAGEYFASTIVGSEVSRELGASRITKPEHAAQATAYLYKSAVERLDGIVTDANGKPLGIVGGFKGALAQASVYPATLMAEAVRIPGAARIWFSHNHPSGNPQLSPADENLNQVLTDVFRGSGIEPMGLLAIGDGRFSHVGNSSGGMISNEQIPAPTSRVSVPVIERTLAPNGITGTTISSPQAAKQVARDFYDRAKQPGLMLLNSQNGVIGWVPITDQMKGELRGTGGLNAIYRAISESNAGTAIIVHGGELTHQSIPKRFPQVTPSENIAAALSRIDVRPLDSIEIRPTITKSAAEIGMSIADGPVFARGNPFYSALTAELSGVNAAAQPALGWANTINGLVKAGKVKQDEVTWSGVLDWLKLQEGKVTREQLVQFLDANGVKVTERVLSQADNRVMEPDEIRSDLLSDYQGRDTQWLRTHYEAELDEKPPKDYPRADLIADLVEAKMAYFEANPGDYSPTQTTNGAARYGKYQLPGGTNYREVLLTLPVKSKWASYDSAGNLKLWIDGEPTQAQKDAAAIAGGYLQRTMLTDAAGTFKSGHWDEPNILAHIRVNDRTDADGKKVLFVEELQSDWAQGLRKNGTQATTNRFSVRDVNGNIRGDFATAEEADAYLQNPPANMRQFFEWRMGGEPARVVETSAPNIGIPDGPFVGKTDAWLSLALKRIVKMAVDEGYDRVAFINGDQSAERYDLSKQVNSIKWRPNGVGGGRTVNIEIPSHGNAELLVNENGKVVGSRGARNAFESADGKQLDEVIGKEIATKVMQDTDGDLSGNGLKVGGEGMKAFYDKIVPNTLKDVLRKVGGGAVEVVDMGGPDRERRHTLIRERRTLSMDDPRRAQLDGEIDLLGRIESGVMAQMKQPGFTITPAMKERAADGLPLFDRSTGALRAVLQSMTGQGMTVEQVQAIVQPMAAKWDVDVRVVARPADLPIKAPSDAMGLHYNGVIYIVARTNRIQAQVLRTLAHETIAHYGLRSMLGRENWRAFMRQIQFAARRKGGPLQEISDYIRRTYVDENGQFNLSEVQEGDEIAARVVELGVDPSTGEFRPGFGMLKAVFARVAEFLRGLGFTIEFTNLELQGMLVRSQRALARRSGRPVAVSGVAAARGGVRADVNRMTSEQMQAEIRSLIPRVEQAYEDGNQPLAERLDARLETLMENLEANYLETEEDRLTAVDMLNPMSAARVADGEQGDTEADLVRDLANTWKEMSTGFGWGNQNLSDAEKATQLRGMVDDYAYRHGGIKPGVTDQQILDAAEDAFQSVYGMRAQQLERIRQRNRPPLTEYRPDDPTPEQLAAQYQAMAAAGDASLAALRERQALAGNAENDQTPIPDWMRTAQFRRGPDLAAASRRASNTAAHYRSLGLQALGRRQITELYGNILHQLHTYNRLMAQMDADKNEVGAQADQIAKDWGNLKDERELAELMHDATLAQMDPEKPLMRGDDPFTYDGLRAKFVALSPEARQVYVQAREAYREHHENVRQAIRDRIERSELRGQRKAELLQQMDSEFYKAIKGVYFPLARFGDYVVIVRDPTGKVLSVNRAETLNEAEALQASLRQSYPGMTVGKVLKSKEFNAGRDAVGRGFMQNLYEALGRADMDDAQRADLEDMLGQLYLSALPDLSWAKHGIHRKGTPGFSQDARRAFAQNTFHGARYLSKVRYSDLLENELFDAQKDIDAAADDESFDSVKAQQVLDEMVKRHDAAMNPDSSALSTALTSVGFLFHLGLSPASAVVNLTQTALVAFPQMGARWGFAKASAALLKASQEAAANRNDISTALSADERRAYDEAVRSGVIDVTMAHDLAGISQGEDAKVSWKLRPIMRWASFLFHHAEKFNRQVTFVAAYRLAREAGSMPVQAYEQAVKSTYDGHFDYSASNRPRLMQGNVARVVLLFKQYAQNMVYTLSRQAYLSMKGQNPYERAQARKALGGLLAMHGAAAGVLGLPVVSTLLAAASFLGGDDDEPWDAEVALRNMLADALGDQAADVLARGLSRLTPWDISGRVGLDKLILPDIQEGLEGQDLANSAMAAALGPVAGIGISLLKGAQEISDGNWLRGLEAMAPSLARGPLKALRYGTEGAIDRTGKPIVEDVGAAGVIGQALGFSPSEVRLATEAKSAVHQADQRLNKRRALLLRQYSMAIVMGDEEGAADARQDILAFNEKNPQRRINPLQMARSVATRKKQIAQSQGGVYLPKSHKDAMQAGQFGME